VLNGQNGRNLVKILNDFATRFSIFGEKHQPPRECLQTANTPGSNAGHLRRRSLDTGTFGGSQMVTGGFGGSRTR
jgi:hypothetical protein